MGELSTWGAAVALIVAAVASIAGRERLARPAQLIGATLAALAVVRLGWALAEGDFTLAYVAETSRRGSTWPYRVAGLWGGMAGSLLLWAALVAACGARRVASRFERAATATLAGAFLAVVAALASPWDHLAAPALDGEGLAPILEHPAMLYHPPILYLGLTGLAVPFATTVGALVERRLDGAWHQRVRRQLLACFAVLTVGMLAGAHWAYVELGWGGYWAWDPVENTALMPWLAALAALHLLRRGAGGRLPAAAAVAAALVLAVLGTTLTRSGAAPSVHAFAEDPAVGRALVAVTVAVALVAVVLISGAAGSQPDARRRRPRGRRALALHAQPWVVAGALLVVLLGTLRPLVGDGGVAVDGAFFARFVAPLALAAAILLVVAGVVRPSRRRPGHLAHVGFLVLLGGVLGTTTGASASATLAPGESLTVSSWSVRNDAVGVERIREHVAVVADVTVLRGGAELAHLRPARVAYPERGLLLAETALRSTPLADVQVVLHSADDTGRALIEVHVRPFLVWAWWGGLLLAASAAWAALSARPLRPQDTAASAAVQRATNSSSSSSSSLA